MYSIQKKFILCGIFMLFASSCSEPVDFYYLDGEEARMTDFNDQWLLINYWAEWCKPCLQEIPELNRFYHQYGKQYAMLSVSFDKITSQQLKRQAKQYDMHYPMIASSPTPNLGISMPSVLPANYILSPTGQQFGPLTGPQTMESILEAFKQAKLNAAQK